MVSFTHATADGLGARVHHLRCFSVIWGSLGPGPSLDKGTRALASSGVVAPDCQMKRDLHCKPNQRTADIKHCYKVSLDLRQKIRW